MAFWIWGFGFGVLGFSVQLQGSVGLVQSAISLGLQYKLLHWVFTSAESLTKSPEPLQGSGFRRFEFCRIGCRTLDFASCLSLVARLDVRGHLRFSLVSPGARFLVQCEALSSKGQNGSLACPGGCAVSASETFNQLPATTTFQESVKKIIYTILGVPY